MPKMDLCAYELCVLFYVVIYQLLAHDTLLKLPNISQKYKAMIVQLKVCIVYAFKRVIYVLSFFSTDSLKAPESSKKNVQKLNL